MFESKSGTNSESVPKLDRVSAKVEVCKAIKLLRTSHDHRFLRAAASLAAGFGMGYENHRMSDKDAIAFLLDFIRHLIDETEYGWAATLLWPSELITLSPKCVQTIWHELNENQSEILIMGCGSTGKTFTTAIWAMMNWIYDPQNTCIKIVSMTSDHAKHNIFAHLKNLHSNSLIPLPGTCTQKSIDIEGNNGDRDDKQGIHVVAIPQGVDGSGRLQGFHPSTRIVPHHKYGNLTRVVAILDEAEEIPPGVWPDVDNMLISKTPQGHVKVIGSTNPWDKTSMFGIRAEPEGGWESLDIDTAEQWKSKLGWKVIRIDGAKFENVTHRKVVFPGFLTWEGYQRYLALGPGSPTYFQMARGWFPETGMAGIIVPQNIWDQAKGQFIFRGRTFYCLSLDLAFDGGDLALATIGRWGEVTGWIDKRGKEYAFDHVRHGLQVEQQFELKKGNSIDMVNQFCSTAKTLHISGEWMAIDRTSAATFYDLLNAKTSDGTAQGLEGKVLGVNYGEAATDEKVMEESEHKASDLYSGLVTELWFSLRQFCEFDLVKIGPLVKMDKLERQVVGRRYKQAKKLVRVEPKSEYKARGNTSPDEADSLTMLVHLVRMRRQFISRMIASSPITRGIEQEVTQHGMVDRLAFMDMTK